MHALHCLCQEHGGLAGGIAAAGRYYLLADAELRLHRRRGIVDTRALEPGEVLERRLPVLRARGDDHRARRHPHAIANLQGVRLLAARQRRCAFRNHDLRTALLGLRVRASGELLA